MELKTKYKIGDRFWLLKDSKAESYPVDYITVNVFMEERGNYQSAMSTMIFYECNIGARVRVTEAGFFPSKQDLLNSL